LVDGGYLNPVPVNLANKEDKILAIDPSLYPNYSIASSFERNWKNIFKIKKPWKQMLKSSDMIYYALSQSQGKEYKHIRIIPEFTNKSFLDFRSAKDTIEIGRKSIYSRISEIQQLLDE